MPDRCSPLMPNGWRQHLGCWMHERWRAEIVLRAPRLAGAMGLRWLDLCNRNERLRSDPRTGGRLCLWQDSSRYTPARLDPSLSARLFAHVRTYWPFEFAERSPRSTAVRPELSIIIPIGGAARLHQFELTLAAARAQKEAAVEIVVVEQGRESILGDALGDDVVHVFQPADAGSQFNKCAALNRGVLVSTSDKLLLLDADYLIPAAFARQCADALDNIEALRPCRWIFYLDDESTRKIHVERTIANAVGVEQVVSNNPTPVAVRRSTYDAIGGHDESYEGWGGEDLEFLDRLRTRDISEAGWMPVLHAWHAPAEKKASGDRNRAHHDARMAVPTAQRITQLSSHAHRPNS